jgi:dATP pyrophosphohydrolase
MPEIITDYFELHIINQQDYNCLLLKRAQENSIYPGIWQMVTGKVEGNEDIKTALVRELKEETGLTCNNFYSTHRINSFYLASLQKICMSPVFFCIVKDKDIKISPEHSEFRWVDFTEAENLIYWPNQVESLRLIYSYLTDGKLFGKLSII